MIDVLFWYLIVSLLAWISLPIAFRFLSNLPDKAYSLIKPLAMLIWGFIFWILGSYGILQNNLAGLLFAFILFLGISYWCFRQIPKGEMAKWLRDHALYVVAVETLFVIAFFSMAILRANNPNALFTEKPMELAFLNAILKSPSMPPNDPWLSGYSISYYYFGYLMLSMIAKIAATSGAIAFNLGLSLTFGMAATASYGLAYNLLSVIRSGKRRANVWAAFLAPVFVLILGNLEGFLEIMHARHIFWELDGAGLQFSSFWNWLDIRELVNPPTAEAAFQPRSYGTESWWWWRASRVINDVNYLGIEQELIDEFPSFSFVLGDLHPHVLSIPYVFLAMSMAFNQVLDRETVKIKNAINGLHLNRENLLFASLVLGGLAFLNIWDFPIYLVLFAGTYAFSQSIMRSWSWKIVIDFGKMFGAVAGGGVLLYLPFYLGFSSQAGGFLPNLLNPTRGAHLWVMFGIFFLPLILYFVSLWIRDNLSFKYFKGFRASALIVFGLWAASLLVAWIFANLLKDSSLGVAILNGLGAPDFRSLFSESISRRLSNSGAWITLLIMLAFPIGSLIYQAKPKNTKGRHWSVAKRGSSFLLILAIFATLLVLAPEFVYLRDNFGTRMNTVFKFYMQAWLVFSTIAAVASVILLSSIKGFWRFSAGFIISLLVLMGLIYPYFAFSDRYRPREGVQATLDSASFLTEAERAAIDWLKAAPLGTLVEAVGSQYSLNARYATHSGQQGVLGWPGHEGQWRGTSVDFYPRDGDIEVLYSTPNWNRALEIINRYEISYVIVSSFERSAYRLSEIKFQNNLSIAFQNAEVSIYQTDQ